MAVVALIKIPTTVLEDTTVLMANTDTQRIEAAALARILLPENLENQRVSFMLVAVVGAAPCLVPRLS